MLSNILDGKLYWISWSANAWVRHNLCLYMHNMYFITVLCTCVHVQCTQFIYRLNSIIYWSCRPAPSQERKGLERCRYLSCSDGMQLTYVRLRVPTHVLRFVVTS